MIQISADKLRWWLQVLEYDPNPEVIIPEIQALLAEAGEPLLLDEPNWKCADCGHVVGISGHIEGLGGQCYNGWSSLSPQVFPCSCIGFKEASTSGSS